MAALLLDEQESGAWVNGYWVHLTGTEFQVLRALADAYPAVVHRNELLQRIWGWVGTSAQAAYVYVARTRDKISNVPGQPVRIDSVRGVGYKLRLRDQAHTPQPAVLVVLNNDFTIASIHRHEVGASLRMRAGECFGCYCQQRWGAACNDVLEGARISRSTPHMAVLLNKSGPGTYATFTHHPAGRKPADTQQTLSSVFSP